jgi:hypothetical protein
MDTVSNKDVVRRIYEQEGATRLVARERYIHGLMRFTTPS